MRDAAGARSWEISLGDRGVLLELVRDPHITGRVVSADGIPSADARVLLRWKINAPPGADRSESPFLNGLMRRRTDDDGRFDIAVRSTEFVTLELKIQDAEGNGARTYGAPLQIHEDIDVGDLALGGVRAAVVIVVDEEGDPVAGAAVFHGRARIGERTDAQGRTNVRLSVDAASFRVGAPLYAVTTVPMSAGGWMKRTPFAVSRSYSAFTSSTANDADGMPSSTSALLKGLTAGWLSGSSKSSVPSRSSGETTVSQKNSPRGISVFFSKPSTSV